ncbi:hypothetical protein Emag_004139 [Eimeria magna]
MQPFISLFVVGVYGHRGASDTDIKRAYRKLSLELHPDKVKARDGNAKAAEELFQQINRAYQVLSNRKSRRLFDTYGSLYEAHEGYYEQLEKTNIPELYSYKKGVHLIYGPNIDAVLRNSEFAWIVSFYQAGCGSCERRVSFFSSLGEKSLETSNVRVAMVNCQMSNLCHYFGIHQLGQILLFPPRQEGGDSWDHEEYSGPLSVQDVLREAGQLKSANLDEASSDRHVKEQLRKLPSSKFRFNSSANKPAAAAAATTTAAAATAVVVAVNAGSSHSRSNGIIRGHTLPYNAADHPGANAIQVAAFIFNTVMGLEPPSLPDPEKRKVLKDEL